MEKLKSNLQNEWNELSFLNVVEDVYGGQCPPHSDLRALLCRFAVQHSSSLKDSPRYYEVQKRYPEFTASLSQSLIERVVELERGLL
jgi:hypothetical protein